MTLQGSSTQLVPTANWQRMIASRRCANARWQNNDVKSVIKTNNVCKITMSLKNKYMDRQ